MSSKQKRILIILFLLVAIIEVFYYLLMVSLDSCKKSMLGVSKVWQLESSFFIFSLLKIYLVLYLDV